MTQQQQGLGLLLNYDSMISDEDFQEQEEQEPKGQKELNDFISHLLNIKKKNNTFKNYRYFLEIQKHCQAFCEAWQKSEFNQEKFDSAMKELKERCHVASGGKFYASYKNLTLAPHFDKNQPYNCDKDESELEPTTEETIEPIDSLIKRLSRPPRSHPLWIVLALLIFIVFAIAAAATTAGPVFVLLSSAGVAVSLTVALFVFLNTFIANFLYSETLIAQAYGSVEIFKRLSDHWKEGNPLKRFCLVMGLIISVGAPAVGAVYGALAVKGLEELPVVLTTGLFGSAFTPITLVLFSMTVVVIGVIAIKDMLGLVDTGLNLFRKAGKEEKSEFLNDSKIRDFWEKELNVTRTKISFKQKAAAAVLMVMAAGGVVLGLNFPVVLLVPYLAWMAFLAVTMLNKLKLDNAQDFKNIAKVLLTIVVLGLILFAVYNACLAAVIPLVGLLGISVPVAQIMCVAGFLGIVPFTVKTTVDTLSSLRNPVPYLTDSLRSCYDKVYASLGGEKNTHVVRTFLRHTLAALAVLVIAAVWVPVYFVAALLSAIFTGRLDSNELLNKWFEENSSKKASFYGKILINGLKLLFLAPLYLVLGVFARLLYGTFAPERFAEAILKDCKKSKEEWEENPMKAVGIACVRLIVVGLLIPYHIITLVLDLFSGVIVRNWRTANAVGNGLPSGVQALGSGGIVAAILSILGGFSASLTAMKNNQNLQTSREAQNTVPHSELDTKGRDKPFLGIYCFRSLSILSDKLGMEERVNSSNLDIYESL